jgi:hypothetical protein
MEFLSNPPLPALFPCFVTISWLAHAAASNISKLEAQCRKSTRQSVKTWCLGHEAGAKPKVSVGSEMELRQQFRPETAAPIGVWRGVRFVWSRIHDCMPNTTPSTTHPRMLQDFPYWTPVADKYSPNSHHHARNHRHHAFPKCRPG